MIIGTGISPAVRAAIETALWSCTLDLDLRDAGEPPWIPVEVVEHGELHESRGSAFSTYGRFFPKTIRIEVHRELSEGSAFATVAHELRHAFQWATWTPEDLANTDRKESDARQYEERAFAEFYKPGSRCGAIGTRRPKLRRVA